MKNFNDDDFELREIQKLEGHTGKVLGITWTVDTGVRGFPAVIASWSNDKTIRIWKQNFAGIFECKAVLEVSGTVRSCGWSLPCKLLAAACSDAATAIFKNVGVHAYERIYTLKGHENEVRSAPWNKHGLLLATCGGDKSIWIWEVLTGSEFDCTSVLQGHTEDVKIVQWDDDALVSGSSDSTIKVWKEAFDDSGDWPCIQTLGESDSKHISTVRSLSLSLNMEKEWYLAVMTLPSRYGVMRWGRIQTFELLRFVPPEKDQDPEIIASSGADDAIRNEKAHEMNVNSVKWHSGDKRLLASPSDDGTVKIWELVCPWPAGHIAS